MGILIAPSQACQEILHKQGKARIPVLPTEHTRSLQLYLVRIHKLRGNRRVPRRMENRTTRSEHMSADVSCRCHRSP